MKNDYCVFILSYKRPDRVDTLKTLRKQGFSGKIYIVVGEDDPLKKEYIRKFGDDMIVSFDKRNYEWVDLADNEFDRVNTVVFARNAVYDIAKKLGYEYFIVLDDDYIGFHWMIDSLFRYKRIKIKNLDKVFDVCWRFYKNTNIDILSFAQDGDFIGGRVQLLDLLFGDDVIWRRKAMQIYFCSVNRRVEFIGRMNDDVNTYVYWGSRGKIFMTIWIISIHQRMTQQNRGGLTDMYKENGTYWKSFTTILYNPRGVKISLLGRRWKRVHHFVLWKNVVPLILEGKKAKKL